MSQSSIEAKPEFNSFFSYAAELMRTCSGIPFRARTKLLCPAVAVVWLARWPCPLGQNIHVGDGICGCGTASATPFLLNELKLAEAGGAWTRPFNHLAIARVTARQSTRFVTLA